MTWSASILTHDLAQRRDVTSAVLSVDASVRYLRPGEWRVELDPAVIPQLLDVWPAQDQARLLFAMRWSEAARGSIVSGPISSATLERSPEGVVSLVLTGMDEWAWLAERRVYPQPADTAPWTTDSHHALTGQASTVVSELIRRHAGDLARPERAVPGLVVVDQGAGLSGAWTYRLAELSHAVRDVAGQAGLAVDVRRRLDGQVEITVGATRNRIDLVLDDSNLASFTLVLAAAKATTVIAGGAGEGTTRLFSIAGDEVAGASRIETFSDQRSISSQPQLDRSAAAQRSGSSAVTALSGALSEEAASRYTWRTHYELGDIISLRVAGSTWPVIVSAVSIDYSEGRLQITPVLGIAPRHELDQLLRDVSGLADRLNNTIEVS